MKAAPFRERPSSCHVDAGQSRERNSEMTYQNISATEANSSNAAAT